MSNWVECNLEDYIKLIDYRGRTPVKTENGVRLITAKNVKLGYLQLEPQEFIAEDSFERWMTRGIPNFGDVIFTTEAPLANVAQIDSHDKLAFAQRIIVMQPNPNKIEQSFLKYMLLSPDVRRKILAKGTGATVTGIKSSLLKKIRIAFPPLPEQQRIVSILDKAFAAIDKAKANAEQNLHNAKELFESISLQKFTDGINIKKWELEKIEKYSQVVVGYVGPISKEYTNNENDILLLSTKNISDEGISLKKLTRINHTFHNKQKKSQLFPGDILVARHGQSGQAAVIPDSIKSAHALNVIIIKKSETILSEYITFLLNSGVLSKIQESKGGSVQEIINTSVIKNLIIPVPDLQHQGKIIEELNNVSKKAKKLEANYSQKLDDLEQLKKSILQKAFAGELETEKAVAV